MAKKDKKLSAEEALVEVFKVSLDYIDKSDKLHMQFLDTRAKFLTQQIAYKEDEEPMKFFKKAHKKWEDELEKLEIELANVYKEMNDEFNYTQEFYKKLKGN